MKCPHCGAAPQGQTVPDQTAALAEALRDYVACGVEHETRGYLVAQVPHVTRAVAIAALARYDALRAEGKADQQEGA